MKGRALVLPSGRVFFVSDQRGPSWVYPDLRAAQKYAGGEGVVVEMILDHSLPLADGSALTEPAIGPDPDFIPSPPVRGIEISSVSLEGRGGWQLANGQVVYPVRFLNRGNGPINARFVAPRDCGVIYGLWKPDARGERPAGMRPYGGWYGQEEKSV